MKGGQERLTVRAVIIPENFQRHESGQSLFLIRSFYLFVCAVQEEILIDHAVLSCCAALDLRLA